MDIADGVDNLRPLIEHQPAAGLASLARGVAWRSNSTEKATPHGRPGPDKNRQVKTSHQRFVLAYRALAEPRARIAVYSIATPWISRLKSTVEWIATST